MIPHAVLSVKCRIVAYLTHDIQGKKRMECKNHTLPGYIVPEMTCCFTGHRQIGAAVRKPLIAAVDMEIRNLYRKGYRYFIAGGAIGFDMLSEIEVLRAARFDRSVELILALPCRNQTALWKNNVELLKQYKDILGYARHVVYIDDLYREGCMRERNQFMVDHSSVCIAYYSGHFQSGAGQTVRMANAAGLGVVNLWDRVNSGQPD